MKTFVRRVCMLFLYLFVSTAAYLFLVIERFQKWCRFDFPNYILRLQEVGRLVGSSVRRFVGSSVSQFVRPRARTGYIASNIPHLPRVSFVETTSSSPGSK